MNTDTFLELLGKSGLVTEDQIDDALALVDSSATRKQLEDAEYVGQAFIEQGLITPWHLRQLLKRRYKGFFIRQYKILGLLGAGGMSTVYLAEHTLMHRRVAIKVLPKERLKKGAYLDHFVREAQMIAALDHPNIIRAYDIDREEDIQYIVMEFFDGINLQKKVETEGPLSVPDIVDYIRQTAEALQYAHKKGIVHRDVKPGNILVNAKNHVKLLDLGLAMIDQKLYAGTLTSSIHESSILGTADYLAPEQAINSQNIDSRADIYSLGCVLYFCLTGHPPFPTGSVPERLLAHQQKEPASILKDRPNTAPDLVLICQKMMAKSPQKRQQTAAEVAQNLDDWLIKHGFKEPATGVFTVPGKKTDSPKPGVSKPESIESAAEPAANKKKLPDTSSSTAKKPSPPQFLAPGQKTSGQSVPGQSLPNKSQNAPTDKTDVPVKPKEGEENQGNQKLKEQDKKEIASDSTKFVPTQIKTPTREIVPVKEESSTKDKNPATQVKKFLPPTSQSGGKGPTLPGPLRPPVKKTDKSKSGESRPGESKPSENKPGSVLLPPGLQGGSSSSISKRPLLPPGKQTSAPTLTPQKSKPELKPKPEQKPDRKEELEKAKSSEPKKEESQGSDKGSDIRIGDLSTEEVYGMKTDVDLTAHEESPPDDSFLSPDALDDLAGKTSIDLESTLHLQSAIISEKKKKAEKTLSDKEKSEKTRKTESAKEKSKTPSDISQPAEVPKPAAQKESPKVPKPQKPVPVEPKEVKQTTEKPIEKPATKPVPEKGQPAVASKEPTKKDAPVASGKTGVEKEKTASQQEPQPKPQPQPQQKKPQQKAASQIKVENSVPLSSPVSRALPSSTGAQPATLSLTPAEQIVIQPPQQHGRILSQDSQTQTQPQTQQKAEDAKLAGVKDPDIFPLANDLNEQGIFAIAGEKDAPPATASTAVKPTATKTAATKTTKSKTGKTAKKAVAKQEVKAVSKKKQFDDEDFDNMLSNFANTALTTQSADENDEAVLHAIEELNKQEEERRKREEAEQAARKKVGIIDGLTLKPALKKELELEEKHGPIAAPRPDVKPSWFEMVPVWFWGVFGVLVAFVLLFGIILLIK